MGMSFRQKNARALSYGPDVPLIHSASNKARQKNTKTLVGEIGKSPHVQSVKQAVAIGYSEQRRAKAKNHKSASSLDHRKVSDWVRGDRKSPR
jgi:Family of unknown function (DUF6496)